MRESTRLQVSGHYAGAVTRLGAFVIDWFLGLFLYGLIVTAVVWIADVLADKEVQVNSDGWAWLIGFVVFLFLYHVSGLTIAGRTFGKSILGLRVVNSDGTPLVSSAALVRVLVYPLSFVFLVGFVPIVLGKRRRALHDMIAKTAVVYDWGDRAAELPTPLSNYLNRKGALEPGAEEAGATTPEPEPAHSDSGRHSDSTLMN